MPRGGGKGGAEGGAGWSLVTGPPTFHSSLSKQLSSHCCRQGQIREKQLLFEQPERACLSLTWCFLGRRKEQLSLEYLEYRVEEGL